MEIHHRLGIYPANKRWLKLHKHGDWRNANPKVRYADMLPYHVLDLVGGAITLLKNHGVRQWEGYGRMTSHI